MNPILLNCWPAVQWLLSPMVSDLCLKIWGLHIVSQLQIFPFWVIASASVHTKKLKHTFVRKFDKSKLSKPLSFCQQLFRQKQDYTNDFQNSHYQNVSFCQLFPTSLQSHVFAAHKVCVAARHSSLPSHCP